MLPWIETACMIGILLSARWRNAILPAQLLSLLFVTASILFLVTNHVGECACFPGLFEFSSSTEHLDFSLLLFFGCLWVWRMDYGASHSRTRIQQKPVYVPRARFLFVLMVAAFLSLLSHARPVLSEGPLIGSALPASLSSGNRPQQGYIVVMLFDTTCPFCIDSLQHLNALDAESMRPLSIWLVSESSAKESDYILRHMNCHRLVFDDSTGRIKSALGVREVPYFLVYADGGLTYKGSGEGALVQVRKVLSSPR